MEGNPGLNGRIEADRGVSGGARFSAEGRKVTMGASVLIGGSRLSVTARKKNRTGGLLGSRVMRYAREEDGPSPIREKEGSGWLAAAFL